MHRVAHRIRQLLKETTLAGWIITLAFIALAAASGANAWYEHQRVERLGANVAALADSLASTTALLSANIDATHQSLSNALAQEKQNVAAVQQQLGGVQNQVGSLDTNVSTLTKLTTTDKELLAKYSKVFFLSENYAPARLAEIPDQYKYLNSRTMQLIPQVEARTEKMLEDAKASGITLYVYSAYRSFASQEILKGEYTVTYGAGTANQFSADQGYSEHQLGTAMDLMTTGLGGNLTDAFGDTPAYKWLVANAYKYGFELSYPSGNNYYIYEPWHWRYVGVKLATYLHDNNLHFYDMDQRTIDTYLADFFD